MSAKRQRIIEALRDRLQAIRTADGYETDAGLAVYLGEAPQLGPDDPPVAIAIIVQDDSPGYQGEQLLINLPIELQAIAQADLDQPYLRAEVVLGDIKRAIELPDRTLGALVARKFYRGITRTVPREDGSTVVGVGITYSFPVVEVWGAP